MFFWCTVSYKLINNQWITFSEIKSKSSVQFIHIFVLVSDMTLTFDKTNKNEHWPVSIHWWTEDLEMHLKQFQGQTASYQDHIKINAKRLKTSSKRIYAIVDFTRRISEITWSFPFLTSFWRATAIISILRQNVL